jgi:hypothetical protein
MILMLKMKRHAFPAIGRTSAIGDGEPAYGTRLIIDPKDADVAVIDKALEEVAVAKWKEDGKAVLAMLKEEKKVCFEKAPYRSKKTGKVYDGFEGMYHLGTRNPKTQPTVFDKYGEPVTDPNKIEQVVYSGCYINAKVELWAQDNSFGRRINCSLLGVMFADDGTSFGGGAAPASADDFAGLAATKADADDVL